MTNQHARCIKPPIAAGRRREGSVVTNLAGTRAARGGVGRSCSWPP